MPPTTALDMLPDAQPTFEPPHAFPDSLSIRVGERLLGWLSVVLRVAATIALMAVVLRNVEWSKLLVLVDRGFCHFNGCAGNRCCSLVGIGPTDWISISNRLFYLAIF